MTTTKETILPTRFSKSIASSTEYERLIAEEMPSPHVPNSNARLVFTHAEGPYLYDVDGNQYIDLDNGKGSIILGHNDPDVRRALIDRLEHSGLVATGRQDLLRQLAARFARDMGDDVSVAFFRTGTAAVRAAAQLARLHTGKQLILSAGYHGWDPMWHTQQEMYEPNSDGVINFFFVPQLLCELLSRHAGKVAAVVISPDHVYLTEAYFRELFEMCRRWPGVLIVDDQVKQGYRYCQAGSLSRYGLRGDLTAFSKAIANGADLSCVCGERALMDPARQFMFTSYFDALPFTAACATLDKLVHTGAQQCIREAGNRFLASLSSQLQRSRLPIEIAGDGNLFRLVFETEELERAFYSQAGVHGVVFHEGDNQTPSAALTDKVYDELLLKLQRTLDELQDAFAQLSGQSVQDDSRWRAAWNQMDGFPYTPQIPLETCLELIRVRIAEEVEAQRRAPII